MNQTDALAAVDDNSEFRGNIETRARQRLSERCPQSLFFEKVSIDYTDGILTLRGQLPSFYLKQMLQEQLRGMAAVAQIDNRVQVVDRSSPRLNARTA